MPRFHGEGNAEEYILPGTCGTIIVYRPVYSLCCTLSHVLQREESTVHYDYVREPLEITDRVSMRVQTLLTEISAHRN